MPLTHFATLIAIVLLAAAGTVWIASSAISGGALVPILSFGALAAALALKFKR